MVNVGTNSAAQLVFTIPRGEKGEPGKDGTGAGTLTGVTSTLPITVNSTDPAIPEIGFDMSLLPSLP